MGANDRGQPEDVISAARADVCDGHPGFDAKQTHELAWFAGCVALFFIMPNRANDISNGTIGVRKRNSRRARIRHELLRRARYSEYGGKKAAIVIRITSPVSNLRYILWSFNFRHELAALGAKRRTNTPGGSSLRTTSPGFADAARLYLPIFVWIEHKIGVEIARVARNFRCGPGRHSKFLGITSEL